VGRLDSYRRLGLLDELLADYLPEIRRLLDVLGQAVQGRELQQAQDALHSLLGMSGEAGALALYQRVRRIYVPVLEERRWPEGPDWLPHLRLLAARTEEALREYGASATPIDRLKSPTMFTDARAILFVDDEATSRKWFARSFGGEFDVSTAGSADEALALLAARGEQFAVLVTDYRMAGGDGLKLLRSVQREHRHLVRLLATAYAEKDVAIAAVNDGKVLRILEKAARGRAHARGAARGRGRGAVAGAGARAQRGPGHGAARDARLPGPRAEHAAGHGARLVASVAARHLPPADGAPTGQVVFEEEHPGELLAALERAERRALYCQSLVSTFVQSARDAYPGRRPADRRRVQPGGVAAGRVPVRGPRAPLGVQPRAAGLPAAGPARPAVPRAVHAGQERGAGPARPPRPAAAHRGRLRDHPAGTPRGCIRFIDNGPGIAPTCWPA
jgi:two-component system response regulator PhcR